MDSPFSARLVRRLLIQVRLWAGALVRADRSDDTALLLCGINLWRCGPLGRRMLILGARRRISKSVPFPRCFCCWVRTMMPRVFFFEYGATAKYQLHTCPWRTGRNKSRADQGLDWSFMRPDAEEDEYFWWLLHMQATTVKSHFNRSDASLLA